MEENQAALPGLNGIDLINGMAFPGGYVVENMAIPLGKEPFNGELCRSRSTQTSNAVSGSQRFAATITVSFPQRCEYRSGGFKETPARTKIAVEATGSWWWFVEKAREPGHAVCLSHPK